MSNFRDFRSKNKIKGSSNDTSFVDFGAGAIGKASLDALIKQARKNGSLNLANRNLKLIPNEIYRINSAPSNDGVNINFDGDNESWWENVFLTKLVIVANSITQINEDIALLSNLTYFDMSDNKVEVLPNSICELIQLRHLNISKNLICTLPSNLCNLSLLQQFLSSNNRLVKVPNFGEMNDLECLDVSNNNLGEFPPGIENLRSLRKLNLSHNQIQRISCSFERPIGLRIIDLSHNKLEAFPDEFCVEVEQLYLHVNKLPNFPITCLHKDLKELSVTHNNIKTFTEAHISNIPSVTTIAIANNAIAELPEKISDLTMLANLDVSNNELRCLPVSLGNMDNLKSLSIEGNPFRAMKRSVIGAGTEVIKEYLRARNVVYPTETITVLSDITNGAYCGSSDNSIGSSGSQKGRRCSNEAEKKMDALRAAKVDGVLRAVSFAVAALLVAVAVLPVVDAVRPVSVAAIHVAVAVAALLVAVAVAVLTVADGVLPVVEEINCCICYDVLTGPPCGFALCVDEGNHHDFCLDCLKCLLGGPAVVEHQGVIAVPCPIDRRMNAHVRVVIGTVTVDSPTWECQAVIRLVALAKQRFESTGEERYRIIGTQMGTSWALPIQTCLDCLRDLSQSPYYYSYAGCRAQHQYCLFCAVLHGHQRCPMVDQTGDDRLVVVRGGTAYVVQDAHVANVIHITMQPEIDEVELEQAHLPATLLDNADEILDMAPQ